MKRLVIFLTTLCLIARVKGSAEPEPEPQQWSQNPPTASRPNYDNPPDSSSQTGVTIDNNWNPNVNWNGGGGIGGGCGNSGGCSDSSPIHTNNQMTTLPAMSPPPVTNYQPQGFVMGPPNWQKAYTPMPGGCYNRCRPRCQTYPPSPPRPRPRPIYPPPKPIYGCRPSCRPVCNVRPSCGSAQFSGSTMVCGRPPYYGGGYPSYGGMMPYQGGMMPYQGGMMPYQGGMMPYQGGMMSQQAPQPYEMPQQAQSMPYSLAQPQLMMPGSQYPGQSVAPETSVLEPMSNGGSGPSSSSSSYAVGDQDSLVN